MPRPVAMFGRAALPALAMSILASVVSSQSPYCKASEFWFTKYLYSQAVDGCVMDGKDGTAAACPCFEAFSKDDFATISGADKAVDIVANTATDCIEICTNTSLSKLVDDCGLTIGTLNSDGRADGQTASIGELSEALLKQVLEGEAFSALKLKPDFEFSIEAVTELLRPAQTQEEKIAAAAEYQAKSEAEKQVILDSQYQRSKMNFCSDTISWDNKGILGLLKGVMNEEVIGENDCDRDVFRDDIVANAMATGHIAAAGLVACQGYQKQAVADVCPCIGGVTDEMVEAVGGNEGCTLWHVESTWGYVSNVCNEPLEAPEFGEYYKGSCEDAAATPTQGLVIGKASDPFECAQVCECTEGCVGVRMENHQDQTSTAIRCTLLVGDTIVCSSSQAAPGNDYYRKGGATSLDDLVVAENPAQCVLEKYRRVDADGYRLLANHTELSLVCDDSAMSHSAAMASYFTKPMPVSACRDFCEGHQGCAGFTVSWGGFCKLRSAVCDMSGQYKGLVTAGMATSSAFDMDLYMRDDGPVEPEPPSDGINRCKKNRLKNTMRVLSYGNAMEDGHSCTFEFESQAKHCGCYLLMDDSDLAGFGTIDCILPSEYTDANNTESVSLMAVVEECGGDLALQFPEALLAYTDLTLAKTKSTKGNSGTVVAVVVVLVIFLGVGGYVIYHFTRSPNPSPINKQNFAKKYESDKQKRMSVEFSNPLAGDMAAISI